MAEPLTLAAVGAVVLNEGVKFLYNQAGEVLKRWRERKKGGAEGPRTRLRSRVVSSPRRSWRGRCSRWSTTTTAWSRSNPPCGSCGAALAPYAQGLDEVDPADAQLVSKADALRRQLEAVLGQRITFRGEQREPSGTPVVVGTALVGRLAGEAAGVLAGAIEGGGVRGELSADEIEAGGEGYGVKVDRIGG